MMSDFTHRPTWPDHRPKHDREVFFEGKKIARITRREHDPYKGHWDWACQWHDERPLNGRSETLEEALLAVKELTPENVLDLLYPDPPEWRPGSAWKERDV